MLVQNLFRPCSQFHEGIRKAIEQRAFVILRVEHEPLCSSSSVFVQSIQAELFQILPKIQEELHSCQASCWYSTE